MKNALFLSSLATCAALTLAFASSSPARAAPQPAGEVIIINTGDRLSPGYRVTVQSNGILSATLFPYPGQKPVHRTDKMIALNRERLFADLAKAEPLARLSTSSSTGRIRTNRNAQRVAQAEASLSSPQILVRFHGQQSPNLRAAGSTPARVLYQDIKQVLEVLRLPIPNQP
ncbi:MAG: hypothetical protein ACRYFS_02150 [Janthinobacterium lividum]